jgi:serine/threonine-protein kinase
MAEVWRGEARFADGHVEPVAIKRVLPALAMHGVYRRMLEDEARIGMLLRHPNIVRVFDAREVRSTYILIMELVDGSSLRELYTRFEQRSAHMPLPAALFIARELARALEHAHEAIDDMGRALEIIHRDVSPHNVLIGVDGSVKLMDFGLANATANLAERDPGMIGGKFGYLSPELVLRKESSHLLDLFALGIILWECITGQRLFQAREDGETVRRVARCEVPCAASINPQVSADLQTVLDGLLDREPTRRYQSARELGVDLDYLLEQYTPGQGQNELSMIMKLHLGAQASQRRGTATKSGPHPVYDRVPRTRTSLPPTTPGQPRLSDTFINDLDTMADDLPAAMTKFVRRS